MTLAAPEREQLSAGEADAVALALADLGVTEPDLQCDLCAEALCSCVASLPVLQVRPAQPARWGLKVEHAGRPSEKEGASALVGFTAAPRPVAVVFTCEQHLALLRHPATSGHFHVRCGWCFLGLRAMPLKSHVVRVSPL